MKTTKFLFVLFSFVGLWLAGCSDEPQSPVTPLDQGSLEKIITREFTATEIPTGIINPGIFIYPDGKIMLKGHRGTVAFTATFLDGVPPDILTGPGEVEINGMIDPVTGVGHFHGKLTLRPEAPEAAGGEWEFTWHGDATFSLTAWLNGPGWTLSIRDVGHGNGGALTGMQCRMDLIISFPPDMSTWTGTGQGFIISH
jgi:hypothetical protein